MSRVQLVQDIARQPRRSRFPTHTWSVRSKPFVIQPVAIAPVLPGETLQRGLMQARALTESLANPLIGWHLEYYWFYVPMRALPGFSTLKNLFISLDPDLSSLNTAAKTATYHGATGVDFVQQCLQAVTTAYFRDEDEAWDAAGTTVDSMPLVKAIRNRSNWTDSLIASSVLEASMPTVDTSGASVAQDVLDSKRWQWEMLKNLNMMDMDYEDYLRQEGIKLPDSEFDRPELLRVVQAWQYPSSAVDGATGAVSSACSWAVAERMDKRRFFREPGFIFGVTVPRPKIYMSKQTSAAVSMLTKTFAWMPDMLAHEPGTKLIEYAALAGPIGAASVGYYVDIGDLFMYGDQFANFSLASTDGNFVALPDVDMAPRYYPSSSDIDGLFIAANATNLVKQDGVISLAIAGTPQTTLDTSPNTARGFV